MIHEYRTYTIFPHLFARYCELAEKQGIPIRRDDYGPLVGFWASEGGTLCQVHHIWEYPGLDSRNAERVRLSENRAWMNEFIAHAWPTMQRQEVRFMQPRSSITRPQGSNIYEVRIYRSVVGRFVEMAEALKSRPRGDAATLVGIYTSESPEPNEVVEIVAYKDYSARLADGTQSRRQVEWFTKHGADLVDIRATPLVPLPISPLK
ncbi:hypothetical protein AYJ54_46090 [Bradyrhizobium centrolobii]|uniref:NIPSNAP domain-containing protein n=1 Tax=Bradyrhizobium centrolobii TaxID=1505087 RepID=A0A176YXZ5_9BRAD|nr:NIPSNAP family protein [Bradyrhizobium centrolobii]OAF12630.1 hypothetical protein AYJ54_46090 [Bradyrhizobium centrolobii]